MDSQDQPKKVLKTMNRSISSAMRRPIALTVIRLILVVPFLLAGVSKIMGFEGTIGYIADGSALMTMPFPALLLVLVIILEIAAPILVVLNRWYAALAAVALAAFCFFSGVFYHMFPADFASLGDQMNIAVTMKNFAWGGGMLALAAMANRD